MNTKNGAGITLAIAVVAMLVAAFAVTAYPNCDLLNALEYTGANTLWVHGEGNFGPGDSSVTDPITGNAVEDLPYTESIAPFDPQHIQAPPKDSITFNPLLLSEFIDSNNGEFDLPFLAEIGTDKGDATEKVFWRQWYEPLHWDKDVDCDGLLTCEIYDGGDGMCDTLARVDDVAVGGVEPDDPVAPDAILITPGPNGVLDSVPGDIDGDGVVDRTSTADRISCEPDEAYPAIMQEFTYMLLEGQYWANKPEPTHGQPGKTQFVFPVGMRATDLDGDCGYGLTSLDADFDGNPDIVRVESELSLFKDITGIAADFNGNNIIDPLDTDGQPLTGDELAVFTIEPKTLKVGEKVQFLDHIVEVVEVYPNDQVRLKVYYTGDVELSDGDTVTVAMKDMLLAEGGSTQIIKAVSNGGDGTNICDGAMPWFAWVKLVDYSGPVADRTATIVVGRALGHAHTAMENSGLPDVTPDPWFVKRFYVDGHEYNVVAVETVGAGTNYSLGHGNCTIVDAPVPWDDTSEFKYITIRTPIPKEGEYEDGGTASVYLIEQHLVRLEVYDELEYLSVMPPFNHEHVMVEDVQDDWSMDPVLFLGPLQYNTAGINQTVAGDHIWYIEELKNPQFTGELLGKYNESEDMHDEWWYAEQYNTKPDLYTEFVLPGGHGLYLLTSAFVAPSAQGQIVMKDGGYEFIINGNRVKFWFDPADGTKIYKDTDGLRVFGEYNRGPGDTNVGVAVPPYTNPVAVFNPQQDQSPREDSITFDPAYMAEFIHTDEPLKAMYDDIKIEGFDAREKAYFRLWYEPEHWDMDVGNDGEREADECYAAVMEEFTYIYLGFDNQPSHGAPGRNTKFAFPIATNWTDLWDSEGCGLNTFDCNFDGVEDVVMVYSEATLAARTGIQADFNGDGVIQDMDIDDAGLTGDEIVVFAVGVGFSEYAMFLDHMIKANGSHLDCYYTGGGLSGDGFVPNMIGTVCLQPGEMAILDRNRITTTTTPDAKDGAWFVCLGGHSTPLLIGRALGGTHAAIEDDAGYMKRFYVDGHEYNVVAVKTVPEDEFKFITIRTPVPKVNHTIEQHSQDLEDYPVGNNITVMPPYNYEHTVRADVQPGWTAPYHSALPDLADLKYMGPKENRPPLEIHIRNETNEPRFYGELREMYNRRHEVVVNEWMTEQFWTRPDQYTEFELPGDQYYLLTSSWYAPQAVWRTVNENNDGNVNWYDGNRVMFWYNPDTALDLYVNQDTKDNRPKPTGPLDKSLVQVEWQPEIYWFQNCRLYWVTDWNVINDMSGVPGWDSVNTLPASEFDPADYPPGPRFITTGAESDGLLIRQVGDYKVYRIENGKKRHITYPDVMDLKGYSFDDVIEVSSEILDMFPLGDPIGIEVDLYFNKKTDSGDIFHVSQFTSGETVKSITETTVAEDYTVETYVRVIFPDGTEKYAYRERLDFLPTDPLLFSDTERPLYPGTWHAQTKTWNWDEYTFVGDEAEGVYTWEFWYEDVASGKVLGKDVQGYEFTNTPPGPDDTTPPSIGMISPNAVVPNTPTSEYIYIL